MHQPKAFVVEHKASGSTTWYYHKSYNTIEDANMAIKHMTEYSSYWQYRIVKREDSVWCKPKIKPVQKQKQTFIQWLFSKI
jgi:hypothetical protein